MNNDFNQHIVIDNGSYSVKAGFNGENAPRTVSQTVIGSLKNYNSNLFFDNDVKYIGEECYLNSSNLKLNYPLEKVGSYNIEAMEDIWAYIFYDELKVSPEAYNVFLIESTFSNQKAREETAEIMFEKFNIFNLHIQPQLHLALWSTAKTTGLVVESDHSTTQILPIYEKHIISNAIKISDIAGLAMTKNFENILPYRLPKNCTLSNPKETARKIKETLGELKSGYTYDNNELDTEVDYILPDGNIMKIGRERYDIPYGLFAPELIGMDCKPIHELIKDSIMECDIHIRKELVGNILIAGGNTMMKGFQETLKKNLEKILGKNFENHIKINSQIDRKYAVWTGASVVCSISNFQYMWISKNEFEELGASVFHKKYII